jgi:hypothetical protein
MWVLVHLSTRETGVLRSLSDGLSEVFNSNQVGVHMVQADVDGMLLCDLVRNLDGISKRELIYNFSTGRALQTGNAQIPNCDFSFLKLQPLLRRSHKKTYEIRTS